MTAPVKLCKNGCNRPRYITAQGKNRSVCYECVKKENRQRQKRNKKYYRKYKTKHKVNCKYCNKEFKTARDNQVFCCESHQNKWHYENTKFERNRRTKALDRVHDKGKKRINGQLYTDKEIKVIIKYYGKKSAVEISKKLDRPVSGVRDKIRKLKEESVIIDESVFI